jgi:ATP-dependent Clp protease ATP-binding subunit ClpB
VMDSVRSAFRPEFLNRLDEILLFRRLGREHMERIVHIQLGHLRTLLSERRITLDLSPEAGVWLGEQGYDPAYGARPLKRVIQNTVQNQLAEMILKGNVLDGATVTVGLDKDGLSFDVQNAPQDNTSQDAT